MEKCIQKKNLKKFITPLPPSQKKVEVNTEEGLPRPFTPSAFAAFYESWALRW